jgi:hypothetical protein
LSSDPDFLSSLLSGFSTGIDGAGITSTGGDGGGTSGTIGILLKYSFTLKEEGLLESFSSGDHSKGASDQKRCAPASSLSSKKLFLGTSDISVSSPRKFVIFGLTSSTLAAGRIIVVSSSGVVGSIGAGV